MRFQRTQVLHQQFAHRRLERLRGFLIAGNLKAQAAALALAERPQVQSLPFSCRQNVPRYCSSARGASCGSFFRPRRSVRNCPLPTPGR
jgi:hypothetical protein